MVSQLEKIETRVEDLHRDRKEAVTRGMVGNREGRNGDPEAAAQSGREITERKKRPRGKRAAADLDCRKEAIE